MPSPPAFDDIAGELRMLRRNGLIRLRDAHLPALSAVIEATRAAGTGSGPAWLPGELEQLLRTTVDAMGGNLAAAAEYTFGLAPGTRDWPVGDRRRRAAQVYGVSAERFRKHHESLIVEELAGRLADLCRRRDRREGMAMPHAIRLTCPLGGLVRTVTVHAMPVELLRDIDIVVCPGNTHLELPQTFKGSFAASLRRACAELGPIGEVLDDTFERELTRWTRANGRPGLPVAPGTVAPIGPGRLADAGIRRIYYAAVAAPSDGGRGYELTAAAISSTVRNVFAKAAAERFDFDPPLRSIVLPLLGAGRGGLDPETSLRWIRAALERELRSAPAWEIGFVTRSAPAVNAVVGCLS